jgi:prepilin-type N-terminal cleavage/methylation domain-containing protein
MIRNQRGFTLIELMATLTIVSLIGVIIWSIFFQGYKFSQSSESKNTIQQKANLIIMNLKKIHQTSQQYTINSSACGITVNAIKKDNSTQNYEFKDSNLCLTIDNSGTVNPSDNDFPIKLTIYEIKNSNNRFEISTMLYRLKDGGI